MSLESWRSLLVAVIMAAMELKGFVHPLRKIGLVACPFPCRFSVVLIASSLQKSLILFLMANGVLVIIDVYRRALGRKSFE